MATTLRLPSLHRSLSARLLVLTIAFVLLGEVLIYVPSISRFRKVYLEERIAAGHLATLSLEAAGASGISTDLEAELLEHAGVLSVTLRAPEARLMLGELPPVDAVFELGEAGPPSLILHAFDALLHGGNRTIRVMGASPQAPAVLVDISLHERPLWRAMVDYSWRILNLSIVLSLMVAFLVYWSLQVLIVRPLRRITESVVAFRHRPDDVDNQVPASERGDEIGLVQSELGRMQHNLRTALAQKTRLAALGSAVTKINHDLRNILANAIILSDRLEQSQDPDVRHVAPRIVDSMDRAARLCSETLTFSRAQAVVPQKTSFALAPLIQEVGAATVAAEGGDAEPGVVRFRNEVRPDLLIRADRDQLFRVLLNLTRNAQEALPEQGGLISITGWEEQGRTVLEVGDTGVGMPASVREHLFEPFSGSTRAGGSGLGLAIAREIMAAHGGDIELVQTGTDGTVFRLTLPLR